MSASMVCVWDDVSEPSDAKIGIIQKNISRLQKKRRLQSFYLISKM
jgi:hypothetical protein